MLMLTVQWCPQINIPIVQLQILQLSGHASAAIAAEGPEKRFPDMRRDNHVLLLIGTEKPKTERPIPARTDIEDLAQPFERVSA